MKASVAARLWDRLRWRKVRPGGRGGFHPALAKLSGEDASGAYVIEVAGEVLYVGSSHKGALYGTITRHFQAWRGVTSGWVCPDDDDARVAWVRCHGRRALALEKAWIELHEPAENKYLQGPDLEAAPF